MIKEKKAFRFFLSVFLILVIGLLAYLYFGASPEKEESEIDFFVFYEKLSPGVKRGEGKVEKITDAGLIIAQENNQKKFLIDENTEFFLNPASQRIDYLEDRTEEGSECPNIKVEELDPYWITEISREDVEEGDSVDFSAYQSNDAYIINNLRIEK